MPTSTTPVWFGTSFTNVTDASATTFTMLIEGELLGPFPIEPRGIFP